MFKMFKQKNRLLRSLLSFAIIITLMLSGLLSAAADGSYGAADTNAINARISFCLNGDGFLIPRQDIEIKRGIAVKYGYTNSVNGITALDALVAALLPVEEDNIANVVQINSSGFVTVYGTINFVFIINGSMPLTTLSETVINNDDMIEFFILDNDWIYADWGMDYYSWFEADGVRVDKVTIKKGEVLELSLKGNWIMWGIPTIFQLEDKDIIQIDSNGNVAVFDDCVKLARTDRNGNAAIAFEKAGTYIISAYDSSAYDSWDYEPLMSPWLEVTVIELVSAVPAASVERLNGNKNNLTVTVEETYSDGTLKIIAETFSIANNSTGIYEVGSYRVYVDTKGNTQIRECYIVT